MSRHEVPKTLEVDLVPVRVNHEVSGDAVAELARNRDSIDGAIDRRVLGERGEPVVRGRLESEEDVEITGDGPPGLEQFRMTRDQVDPRLHQHPVLANPSSPERLGEGAAARRVMPEEVISDEDLITGVGKVLGHRVDRALPDRSIHQLPNRTERATERTATRGFNQVSGTVVQAGIPAPPAGDEMPGRLRRRHRD